LHSYSTIFHVHVRKSLVTSTHALQLLGGLNSQLKGSVDIPGMFQKTSFG